jgi:hypothetical protein
VFRMFQFALQSTSILELLIASGLIASFSIWIILALSWKKLSRNFSIEKGMLRYITTINCILGLFIFATIPFQIIGTVDRSRSLYIFEWVGCAPAGATKMEIAEKVEEVFGRETRVAYNLRLEEQKARGFMSETRGIPELTPSGRFVFKSAIGVSKFFSLSGWKENSIWAKSTCG